MTWKFENVPNTAVFTSPLIVSGDEWIYYVSHDEDDGAWQFHPYSGVTPEDDAVVVSLRSIVELDPSVNDLAGLPLGFHAWREDADAPWQCAAKE